MNEKKEARRKKSLGELGELFAIKALVDQQFDRIRNLNDTKNNYPFFDLAAEKNGEKYLITVKARNKYQKDRTVNTSYKLGKDPQGHAEAEKARGITACWIAVQFDSMDYSLYFGKIEALGSRTRIPMDGKITVEVGELWVKNKRHFMDWDYFTNESPQA